MTSSSSHSKRIAGLDVGDKRIGVAVSDGLGLTAQPVGVVARRALAEDVRQVLEALADYDLALFVAGLPLEASASEGYQAGRVRRFCDALADAAQLEVVYQDERLTSAQSERMLVGAGMRRNKRRKVIDKLAAVLILQSYLDRADVSGPTGS